MERDFQLHRDFARILLDWYDSHARILPWRDNPTPYRIWVSEIMLQQTRVEAVKPYYERFMARLPAVKDLAAIDDGELHKLWEGLGYYSRVRNMKKAAQYLIDHHQGQLPKDPKLLTKLPGIGPYTAGAIASIAYQQPVPAVDGNVLRVLSRMLGSYADIDQPATKKAIEEVVRLAVPQDRAGDFNQALMELGAVICLPNAAPKCEQCPQKHYCQAYRSGCQLELPVKTRKKPRKIFHLTVLLVTCQDCYALQQRTDQTLLHGMWEFPSVEGHWPEDQLREILQNEWELVSFRLAKGPYHKHLFTHLEWHMETYLVKLAEKPERTSWIWANLSEVVDQYAIPSAFQYAVQFIRKGDK